MSSSVCETYPGICSKSRLARPRPTRLFHPANDNSRTGARPHIAPPAASQASVNNPMSVIGAGSVISMLGLLIFATHKEIAAIVPTLAFALDQFLASAPVALW